MGNSLLFWIITFLIKYSSLYVFYFLFILSALWIHHVTPTWPAKFLLKNLLTALWDFSYAFNILFITTFSHWNYYMSWCGPPWVHLVRGFLCFLSWICYLPQVREVFGCFLSKFSATSSLSSGIPMIRVSLCLMMSLNSLNLFSFFITFLLFSLVIFHYLVF